MLLFTAITLFDIIARLTIFLRESGSENLKCLLLWHTDIFYYNMNNTLPKLVNN